MIRDDFFRSMSLAEDLGEPTRFAHYKPTRRAAPVLAAVLEAGAATMVIAPYGSGKSLAAGVASLAVSNGEAEAAIVAPLADAICRVDGRVGASLSERLASGRRGKVVALTGHISDPIAAIAAAIGMAKPPQTMEGFGKALRDGGWDHVAIVWDEFGRHLEGIVADGRPDELDALQRLAERCTRASGPTMSLTLLLHQNLLSYATRLNETTRSEWRKVEGRFSVLRMVEDSREIYELVAEVISDLRGTPPATRVMRDAVQKASEARWFDEMADHEAIGRLLLAAQPLTPGALQVLPTLSARVGQNERSLFTFLREAELSATIGMEEVYNAFADALRSDVGVGGAYRRWLETESARSRARDGLQREALAAACLLQLGASGERRRLPRDVLELSLARPDRKSREITAAIDALIDAKLLLWRRHNDDVAVWHGADIDVASRVREERDRQAIGFDLRRFLVDRFPAPNLRATGHNARCGVNRFFAGRYVVADQVDLASEDAETVVAYVLATNRSDIVEAEKRAKLAEVRGRIIVIPKRPIDVQSAAIEVLALEALRSDRDFLASDPMVNTELDELESVAFEQLAVLLRSLLDPRASSADWWSQGEPLDVSADRPGSIAASDLLDRWYALTPRIANEQLMRDVASRTMQTARVRVVGALMERHARKRLGYEPDDRSAEASIYRTVLENTGIHRAAAGGWTFAGIDDPGDPGLRAAWTEIGIFFRQQTDAKGKPLSHLLDQLAGPPHGVPRAVLPLLVAAGYKAFARVVAVYRDGVYLPDMLGFQFDQLVTRPEDIVVRVEAADIRTINYLREVCYAFTHEQPGTDEELVRAAHDAVSRWRMGVPEGSRRTQRLDGAAKGLLRAIDGASDPLDLLLKAIPAAIGDEAADASLIPRLERARSRIDELAEVYAEEATTTLCEAFRTASASDGLLQTVRDWAACFDHRAMEARADLRISDKAVLRKALETANGRFSPKSFAGALSSILLQRPLDKWDDRTASQFRATLRETRERIETAALDTSEPDASLRPIVAARLEDLRKLLARMDAVPEHPGNGVKTGRRRA